MRRRPEFNSSWKNKLHGVSFRIVYFETVAVTILLDILITKYDFYIAKNWSFWYLFLLYQKNSREGLNWAIKNFKKFQKNFSLFFALKYLFKSFRTISNDKIFFKKIHFFSMQRFPAPFGSKKNFMNFEILFWNYFL